MATSPQQPGGAVPGHGPVREGGAALPAQPGDPRGQAGQGPPRRGHQPQQPGGAVPGHGPVRQGGAALPAQPGDPRGQAGQGPPRRGLLA